MPVAAANIRELEDKFLLQTYDKLPLTITRGEGVYVFDDEGKRYLDFYGGHAVAGVGHCHPMVVKAIIEQAQKLIFYSNVVYNDTRALAAQLLCQNAYPKTSAVYFCNSGTEANETALKIARRATGRPRVIAMQGGFHGRTIGSLSVTHSEKMRSAFPENLSQFTDWVPFGDYEALERAIGPEHAAIILEPVQSTGGVRVASRRYYESIRELCAGNGCALIFDEVQTGFGRTGKPWFGMHYNVEPDISTSAKSAGGGVPIGLVLLSEAIREAPAPGEHGSTFGGGMIAMAALKATIEVIVQGKLWERATEMENQIRDMLGGVGMVQTIKGKGMLLGVDLNRPAKPVVLELIKRGVIVGTSGPANQVRLLAPLTIESGHVKELAKAMAEVSKLPA